MGRFFFLTLIAFCLFMGDSARAEYRAFNLIIRNTESGTERRVITTLDNEQYPMYHTVKKAEVVEIAETWMCYQRNDYGQSLCVNPNTTPGTAPATSPASGPDRAPAAATP